VRLSDVVTALSDLRNQSLGKTPIRTAVMTLMAVIPGDEQAYAATRALRALGRHHPARIVLLRPDPDEVATLDARAALFAVDADGSQVHFEEVTLIVGGQAANHLDSLVEAFTLSDLPVPVWYVGSIPDSTDQLLSVGTAVLVDSRDAAGAGRLRTLLELARRRTVVDLSWIRLQPWRELLASLFDPPERRPWLDGVQSVQVTGKIGPRQLLGGWLLNQLRLTPDQVHLTDAQHVEIRVECRLGSDTATFEVGRGNLQRTVSARSLIARSSARGPGASGDADSGSSSAAAGGAVAQPGAAIPLAGDPLATSLSEALTHLQPDPVWERALSAASSFSR
jgi:glucose-6-phosphate dehydrogenase assembly protein OpcA